MIIIDWAALIFSLLITLGVYCLYRIFKKISYGGLRLAIVPAIIIVLILLVTAQASTWVIWILALLSVWLAYPLLLYLALQKSPWFMARIIIPILLAAVSLAVLTPMAHYDLIAFPITLTIYASGIVLMAPIFERYWEERKKAAMLLASALTFVYFFVYVFFSMEYLLPATRTISLPFNLSITYSNVVETQAYLFLDVVVATTIFYALMAIATNMKPLFGRAGRMLTQGHKDV